MPDIGHVVVGLYAGRLKAGEEASRARALRLGALLGVVSLLPDFDMIPRALGVPDASVWGHRGALHSLAAAVVVGAAVALWRGKDGLWAFAVMASHGALDMLDTGRLGVAYLWPFSPKRFFWPDVVRFLPGPPPGEHWATLAGARVIALGALPFLPLLFLALRPRASEPAAAESTGRQPA